MPKPVGIGPMPTSAVIDTSAGSEQLLGVRSRATGAAEFLRRAEVQLQRTVGRFGRPSAAAGGCGAGGVENFGEGHGVCSFSDRVEEGKGRSINRSLHARRACAR